MSEEMQGNQEVEIAAGDKKLKLRGSDLLTSVIGMIVCSGLALLGYVLWDHKSDAKESSGTVVTAIKEMTQAAKDGVQAQRVMNCLISTDQKDREAKLPMCERLAK